MTIAAPGSFFWGASTAAHQIEGNNVNSDWWQAETREGSPFPDRSGDAVDGYHRYEEDIATLARAGLTAYRFSIEWARIEPVQGMISQAELDHYRRIIDCCLDAGVRPVITLHHFTLPRWFAEAGGWENSQAVEHFATYVRAVVPILSGVEYVVTINEPNTLASVGNVLAIRELVAPTNMAVPNAHLREVLAAAHKQAVGILRQAGLRAGWSVNTRLFHPVSDNTKAAEVAERLSQLFVKDFLEVARGDDFVGVQAYTYVCVGEDGPVAPSEGTRLTKNKWPFYPEALHDGIQLAHEVAEVPVLITENGIATDDDAERIEYMEKAISGLQAAQASGIEVLGYLHWTLLDNYEWGSYFPTFGLIAVDRENFTRTAKPSLARLGRFVQDQSSDTMS